MYSLQSMYIYLFSEAICERCLCSGGRPFLFNIHQMKFENSRIWAVRPVKYNPVGFWINTNNSRTPTGHTDWYLHPTRSSFVSRRHFRPFPPSRPELKYTEQDPFSLLPNNSNTLHSNYISCVERQDHLLPPAYVVTVIKLLDCNRTFIFQSHYPMILYGTFNDIS